MRTADRGRPRVVRKRVRRHADGRVRRPDAAVNGRPRKVMLTGHGTRSRALLRDALDMRSRAGRAFRVHEAALVAHLGGAVVVTVAQRALIDQAARLRLMGQIAWAELQRTGAFRAGELVSAYDALRRAMSDERQVLALLGLQRREAPVPSLQEFLAGAAREGEEPQP